MVQFAIALAPIAIVLFYIYKKDKYDKEPKRLIIKLMILGALGCIPAIILELTLGEFIPEDVTNKVTLFLHCLIVIALVEEGIKFLVLRWLTWRNNYFTERFDGIVYSVSVSLGFAALENILYVFQNGVGTGILRAFTAVPMHTVFGIFMGYFYGKARFVKSNKLLKTLSCLFLPVLFHGIYDFFALASSDTESGYFWMLILFLIIMVVLSIIMVRKQAAKKTGYIEPWSE